MLRALLIAFTIAWEVYTINPLLTADCGVVDQCGLAYRPRVQPTGARYTHIAGPWYLLYEPF